ncbi:helix-turn-helix domain-containing protein [Blastococcus sp. Marseille-P5729]|uniref:helix-turn-helix domain-containing protein n=1 Tax=Blastococcus sp. Marseille-P5729 TaxID=2086582 RepID=UPI000D0E72A2|nr:helix-turn-helix domain-containing protein [Blastococcus sp. Marseille-P5729]
MSSSVPDYPASGHPAPGDRASDQITRDSRGILNPGRMREHADFVRLEPTDALGGIVQWFWAVRWSMPDGAEFVQPVLSHPSANLSVGPRSSRGLDDDSIGATAVGVVTSIDRRRLRGTGWNVAAKLEPGALGAFLHTDATELTDRIVPLGDVIDVDGAHLASEMTAAGETGSQVAVLADALADVLERADPQRLRGAREAAALGSLIERDRSIRNVAQLSRATGLGARTMQRLFREHAGVSPLWMIRRYRLIEAADAARSGQPRSWSELAANLGYADQAHLSRDFKATVGMSPRQYAASVTAVDDGRH